MLAYFGGQAAVSVRRSHRRRRKPWRRRKKSANNHFTFSSSPAVAYPGLSLGKLWRAAYVSVAFNILLSTISPSGAAPAYVKTSAVRQPSPSAVAIGVGGSLGVGW